MAIASRAVLAAGSIISIPVDGMIIIAWDEAPRKQILREYYYSSHEHRRRVPAPALRPRRLVRRRAVERRRRVGSMLDRSPTCGLR